MTVGEKIQKYRKELSLSQDELGQKLLVSRQTISLWEKDQTVPTIDNLIRLKEIFGVSVDDILGGEEKEQDGIILPNETYKFGYTAADIANIKKLQISPIYKKLAIPVVLTIIVIISMFAVDVPDAIIGFFFGILYISLATLIKTVISSNKAWKKTAARMLNNQSEYLVFDCHMIVNMYRGGEKTREFKVYFSDIEQIRQVGDYILFQASGLLFILKKELLKENSAFYAFMHKNPLKTKNVAPMDRWRIASIVLFIASFLSIYGALVLVNSVPGDMLQNMWMFFLLTPVPISSIVLGFILKAKGYKYKKNIIAGFIMTFFLCVYGCFTFIF